MPRWRAGAAVPLSGALATGRAAMPAAAAQQARARVQFKAARCPLHDARCQQIRFLSSWTRKSAAFGGPGSDVRAMLAKFRRLHAAGQPRIWTARLADTTPYAYGASRNKPRRIVMFRWWARRLCV